MTQFAWIPSGPHQLATSIDLPDAGGPWPVVLTVHGLTGHRLGFSYLWVELARRLNEIGIVCVRFDQAGCGESSGEFVELTIPRMVADLRAVHEWTAAQPWCRPNRLGYTALSLGALAAVAVEAEFPGRAMALWAPVFDMPRVFKRTARTGLQALLQYQGWVPYRGLKVGKCFVDKLDAVHAAEQLAEGAADILLCHSRVDEVVGFEESQSYVEVCEGINRPCKLLAFDNANHDFTDVADRQPLLKHTTQFFKERLPG